MLIDIPEQIKCSGCPFSEEGTGWCLLAGAINPKEPWWATDWSNKGWRLEDDEECRPDWCPLKATEKSLVEGEQI